MSTKDCLPLRSRRHAGRFLIRGGSVVSLEATWTPNRLTVIEFPSSERAETFVRSAE